MNPVSVCVHVFLGVDVCDCESMNERLGMRRYSVHVVVIMSLYIYVTMNKFAIVVIHYSPLQKKIINLSVG